MGRQLPQGRGNGRKAVRLGRASDAPGKPGNGRGQGLP